MPAAKVIATRELPAFAGSVDWRSLIKVLTSIISIVLGSVSLTLCGCAGFVGAMPDSVLIPASHGDPIVGSVFGGHAPVVGSHVYVLQAGTGGYATASVNIMTAGSAGSDANGAYVVTHSDGSFWISGDYVCIPGSGGTPGLPVYLVATGGAPYTAFSGPNTATASITQASPAGQTADGSNYILTFAASNQLSVGQNVAFAGLAGAGWSDLNNTTQTVYSSTPTSFTILSSSVSPTAAGQSSATATPVPAPPGNNPAVANIALLGNCPTPGNFSTSGTGSDVISWVYMNEVSTTAAAYALSGFGSGPFNVAIPSSDAMAQVGIENAANNAAQLYDIQGKYLSNVYAGEGHIANPTTPVGGGTVAQTTLDTLGNIVASCVDSANTANSATNPAAPGASASCGTLFAYATSNGIPYGYTGAGTLATDTATALFNIAHNPAGNPSYSSNYMTRLFALQGAQTAPFSPSLTSAPSDFTVAIQFPVSGQPESVAVDATGNYWYTAQLTTSSSNLVQATPLGSLYLRTSKSNVEGDVAVDSSGNAWTGDITGLSPATEAMAGTARITNQAPSDASSFVPIPDASGNVYFAHGPSGGYPATGGGNVTLGKMSASRSSLATSAISSSFSTGNSSANYFSVRHGAMDQTGYLWLASEAGGMISRIQASTSTGSPATGFPVGNPTYVSSCTTPIVNPEQPAIDASGNAWIPINNGGSGTSVLKLTPAGACTSYPVDSGPYGAAVDGANTVWVTNKTGNSVTQINATTGLASANYKINSLLSGPAGIAVDVSGDLLITNYVGSTLVEVIGIATPTYAPLGVAAANNKLGAQP